MAKKITEEDLRLNITINGDQGRKALSDLKSTVDASTKKLSQLKTRLKELAVQSKATEGVVKGLTTSWSELLSVCQRCDSSRRPSGA